MKRAIFDIILLASLFLLPWWTSALLACIGIFLFVQFYEFLAVGIVVYSLYVIPQHGFITKPIWFAIVLSFTYVGIQVLRRYLILYQS
jgi:hypothetical protein